MFFDQLGWIAVTGALLITEALAVRMLRRGIHLPAHLTADEKQAVDKGRDALLSLLLLVIVICAVSSGIAVNAALHRMSWGVATAIAAVSTGLYLPLSAALHPRARQQAQRDTQVALLKEQQP